MTDEFVPRLKELADCPCGCGLFGSLLAKTYSDGSRHVRGCHKTGCKKCLGRKSRKSGLDAQRRAAKRLGVPNVGPLRPSNEEHYGGLLRTESKSGAIVKPLWNAYLKAESQSEAQRPHGDNRPFVMTAAVQPASKSSLVVFRSERIEEVVYALACQLGLIEQ